MRTIPMVKNEEYRLYIIDDGGLADFCYADDKWVVYLKQNPDADHLTPLALQNRYTGEILGPEAYTESIRVPVEQAVSEFMTDY